MQIIKTLIILFFMVSFIGCGKRVITDREIHNVYVSNNFVSGDCVGRQIAVDDGTGDLKLVWEGFFISQVVDDSYWVGERGTTQIPIVLIDRLYKSVSCKKIGIE